MLAALALLLTACGGDGPSDDEMSAWAEVQCRDQGADEYANPEGWDRCIDDFLPKAAEGIAADEQAEDEFQEDREAMEDLLASREEAMTEYADDPRCRLYDGSGREQSCIEDFGLEPGAENFAEPVPVTDDTSGLPSCSSVWVAGATLPSGYEGCIDDDQFYPPSRSVCQDKGEDGLEPVGDMILWSTPDQSYFAKSLYDYKIKDATILYKSENPTLPIIHWESMTCSVSGNSDWYATP